MTKEKEVPVLVVLHAPAAVKKANLAHAENPVNNQSGGGEISPPPASLFRNGYIMNKTSKTCSCAPPVHADHSKEIPRLNRIIGQIEGIKKMIESRRYCPDILTQMRAVRSAIRSVEANILQDHLQSCVMESLDSPDVRQKKIEEIKEIFNRFEN